MGVFDGLGEAAFLVGSLGRDRMRVWVVGYRVKRRRMAHRVLLFISKLLSSWFNT